MAVLAGRKISGLMLDLSGTVHIGDQLLPGVSEAVSLVRGLGLPVQFVTNTSKESLTSLTERVKRAGLDVDQDSIFTSLTAARDLGNMNMVTGSPEFSSIIYMINIKWRRRV